MDERQYFLDKFNINLADYRHMPIEIPNVGRNNLSQIFFELGYTVGAEIGVDAGRFSLKLLKHNPNLKLYCVDPWENYDGYADRLNETDIPQKFEVAQNNLKGKNVEFIRAFSMDAVKRFDKESLDFVYIDGNHDLPWVMDDIIEWEKRVRKGGVIAGHDYVDYSDRRPTKIRVKWAVKRYTELKRIKPWFVLGLRHNKEGMIRDSSRSWMWIK